MGKDIEKNLEKRVERLEYQLYTGNYYRPSPKRMEELILKNKPCLECNGHKHLQKDEDHVIPCPSCDGSGTEPYSWRDVYSLIKSKIHPPL